MTRRALLSTLALGLVCHHGCDSARADAVDDAQWLAAVGMPYTEWIDAVDAAVANAEDIATGGIGNGSTMPPEPPPGLPVPPGAVDPQTAYKIAWRYILSILQPLPGPVGP